MAAESKIVIKDNVVFGPHIFLLVVITDSILLEEQLNQYVRNVHKMMSIL